VNDQLAVLRDEFLTARQRLHELAAAVPDDLWARRPAPAQWSVAECVAHLNLTAARYEPIVGPALDEARRLRVPAPARYRRDPIGWVLWRTMGPPVRWKATTAAAFVPTSAASKQELLEEFDRWQAVQLQWVEAADGLPIHRVRIRSPFDARVRYNLFSCLAILPRHQERHIWQGWQALRALGRETG
jgi:DinB superfamily